MANDTQKKTGGFFQDNKNALIVAAIVIIVLAVYFSTRDKTTTGTQNDRKDTEQSEEMRDESSDSMKDEEKMADGDSMNADKGASKPTPTATPAATSNVQFSGMLKMSQDASKGNYMVSSDRGIIYLQTSRDLSAWAGKNVIVNAEGNISQFSITDITPADGMAMADKGGANEMPDMANTPEVTFSGTLQKSAGPKGNYSITNGKTVVQLQTSKDYSAWVGKTVVLTAQGTLQNFNHAMIVAQ